MITVLLSALLFLNATCNDHIIREPVPAGIVLQDCGYGYGLFASKAFKKGEVLYKLYYKLVSDAEQEYLLITDQGTFTLLTTTHSVIMGNGKRALYFFDSFINHSCDPNSISVTTPEMTQACEYYQVATRDIQVGDEITCDYNLFDYDCRDKKIDDCRCGAVHCRRRIHGFKWLPLSEQMRLLPHIDSSIVEQFLQDHPEIRNCE